MAKPAIIKVRGEIEVKGGVSLMQLAEAMKKAEAILLEVGTGAIKIHVPRGEYGV